MKDTQREPNDINIIYAGIVGNLYGTDQDPERNVGHREQLDSYRGLDGQYNESRRFVSMRGELSVLRRIIFRVLTKAQLSKEPVNSINYLAQVEKDLEEEVRDSGIDLDCLLSTRGAEVHLLQSEPSERDSLVVTINKRTYGVPSGFRIYWQDGDKGTGSYQVGIVLEGPVVETDEGPKALTIEEGELIYPLAVSASASLYRVKYEP